jgi:hypothetical protein
MIEAFEGTSIGIAVVLVCIVLVEVLAPFPEDKHKK